MAKQHGPPANGIDYGLCPRVAHSNWLDETWRGVNCMTDAERIMENGSSPGRELKALHSGSGLMVTMGKSTDELA